MLLFLVLAALPVLAQGPPPPPPADERHQFFGTVTVAGLPAPDGTIVSGEVDSLSWSTFTEGGGYGKYLNQFGEEFWIPLDDPETPAKDGAVDGDVITFKVNGVVVTTFVFKAGEATLLNLALPEPVSAIFGVTGEPNCDILPTTTVTLKKDDVVVCATTSDGTGDYVLPLTQTGDYEVVASKAGFRDETQEITIPSVAGDQYELDFIADTGLVPNAPDMSYVLACVNRWLFPPSPECALTMSKVLEVVNAWLYPV